MNSEKKNTEVGQYVSSEACPNLPYGLLSFFSKWWTSETLLIDLGLQRQTNNRKEENNEPVDTYDCFKV